MFSPKHRPFSTLCSVGIIKPVFQLVTKTTQKVYFHINIPHTNAHNNINITFLNSIYGSL